MKVSRGDDNQLTRWLTAAGRAHDLVRRLPGAQGNAALLGDVISVLLAPYDDLGAFSGRIRVAVPRMGVGERSANALAMVMYELATNPAKHGALSCDGGSLDVSGEVHEDQLKLVWAETGGPEIAEMPELKGFGSALIVQIMANELGGSVEYDWQTSGLVAKESSRSDLLAH